jgi:hypothetical protein
MAIISHVLSNGVIVEESSRKGNRTGYTGAALSVAWTLNPNKPFIAACGNPTDPRIMAQVNAQSRTSLHLGHYADAREAAYVIGQYRKDPVATIQYVQSNGAWEDFPADLYDLPEGLAHEEAIEILKAEKLVRAAGKKVVIQKKDTSVQASGNLYDFFDRPTIVSIVKLFDGSDKFQASLKGKSIADFANEYGLSI